MYYQYNWPKNIEIAMITKLQITGKLHYHRKCDFQLSKRKLGYRTLLPLTAPIQVASKLKTFLPKLGTLGLWVLELFAVYATDRETDGRMDGWTKATLIAPFLRSGIIMKPVLLILVNKNQDNLTYLGIMS